MSRSHDENPFNRGLFLTEVNFKGYIFCSSHAISFFRNIAADIYPLWTVTTGSVWKGLSLTVKILTSPELLCHSTCFSISLPCFQKHPWLSVVC